MTKTFSILISLSFLITGCSWWKKPQVTLEPKQPLAIQDQRPLELRKFEWKIVTEENFFELMEELRSNGIDPVLFALTDNGYEALSLNFSEIMIFLEIERDQLEKYKLYYEPSHEEK